MLECDGWCSVGELCVKRWDHVVSSGEVELVVCCRVVFFFCKQKTAYEMRISDWSSDVCSSDLMMIEAFEYPIVAQGAEPLVYRAPWRKTVGQKPPGTSCP